ncbi:hypothetical protein [Ottowia sp.]|uniref:hypothetical protein n=1 Tax=Ottowia sp. TaxID=1898956 RepID=UPI003A88C6C3
MNTNFTQLATPIKARATIIVRCTSSPHYAINAAAYGLAMILKEPGLTGAKLKEFNANRVSACHKACHIKTHLGRSKRTRPIVIARALHTKKGREIHPALLQVF